MADETDRPVNRDGWRSLLAQGGGEPSELTDARIRAAARQAIPPRSARWWLPASLAASMLLAVLVVQWQYESRSTAAVMTESDVAIPAAAPASERMEDGSPALPDREDEKQRESDLFYLDREPRTPSPAIDLPTLNESRAAPAEESLRAEAESPTAAVTGRNIAPPAAALAAPPVVVPEPAPAREAAASKSAADEDLDQIVVTGSRRRQDERESTTPVTQVTSQGVTGGEFGELQKSSVAEREPAEWYAEIEELRAAGRNEEAERELEKLEAAHPGWLEEHLKQEQQEE